MDLVHLGSSSWSRRGILLLWKLDPSLASRLHVALVIAADAIANVRKVEVAGVKHDPCLVRNLNQLFSQPVVVLLLLRGVVHVRMT